MTVAQLRAALADVPDETLVCALDGVEPVDVHALMDQDAVLYDYRSRGVPAEHIAALQRCLGPKEVYVMLSHFA